MASWSERELEDELWADSKLVWPADNFYWIGRQVGLWESRVDLMGVLETGTGRRLAVVELKAHKASGKDLTQLLSYTGLLRDELHRLPSRANASLSNYPIFGILIAPSFTRRLRRAVDYGGLDIMLLQAHSPHHITPVASEWPTEDCGEPPHDAIVDGLCARTWTLKEVKERRARRGDAVNG